jgi:hypothetical protein
MEIKKRHNDINMKNTLGWALAMVFAIALLRNGCHNGANNLTLDTVKIDTQYVELPAQTKYITKLVPKTIIKNDTIINNITDTSYVIGDYYATKIYEDSVEFTGAKLFLTERISENAIQSRLASLKMTQAQITKTNYMIHKKQASIGVGGSVMFGSRGVTLSVDGVFTPAYQPHFYFVGYDLVTGQMRVGAAFKFNLKGSEQFEPAL